MSTISETFCTPRYILLFDKPPIGPAVATTDSGKECFAIYGFSGKQAYDRFVSNSSQELRPYPLMEGYLRKQSAFSDDTLRLVVLDAVKPNQEIVEAVSMQSALAAQSANAIEIGSDYQLKFDFQAETYRLQEIDG